MAEKPDRSRTLDDVAGQLAGATVLAVDDHADTRETLEALLSAFGIRVLLAASGDEAFAIFKRHRPSIIVSDVQMPGGSGLDLMRSIRALGPAAGGLTPAIAVSAGASADESLDAGFHYHFVKPVDPMVLLDAIRDFVSSDQLGRARWAVERRADDALIRLDGHVTAADMRAAVGALVQSLERCADGCRVVSDIRNLTGFDPSVGAVAQSGVWDARHKLKGVLVVGGSLLARAISRSCCLILGIPYAYSDNLDGDP